VVRPSDSLGEHVEFVTVLPSAPDTVSRFLELGRAYLSELDPTPEDVNERFLQSILRRQIEPDRWLLLLTCGGEDIGFAHAKIDRDERPGWGYILEFYIVPRERRRGWGSRLFTHVTELLKLRGVRQVWLTSNERARDFWLKLGFQATGEKEHGQEVMVLAMS